MKDNTASKTALVVAIGLIILGGDGYGSRKCPPKSVELQKRVLRESGLFPRFLPFWLISNAVFSKLVRWSLSLVVYRGILEGLGVRKLFMEERVRAALSNGSCRQVLVLAAGYDTLALRLSPEYSDVHFWEVDHPGTARRKQKAMDAIGQPANFHMVEADLTQTPLPTVLSSCPVYDAKAPTVIITEGLLMYLTEAEVKKLFHDVAQVVGTSKNSTVCFDYFGWNDETSQADVGWLAAHLHWHVKTMGEDWKWGIESERLPEFFDESTSWRVSYRSPQRYGLENLATVERRI